MPVKLDPKIELEHAEARIEIIPLIDIMFFLLASFMLVSLSMVNLRSVKVNLPTATTAAPDTRRNLIDISVNQSGGVFLNQKPVASHELVNDLISEKNRNPDLRIFISGDRNARHGDIIHVLDLVRLAGIDRVAFEIRTNGEGAEP